MPVATVESYLLKSGAKRYRVRYRTPDRRQTDKRGFTTKRDAQAFAATVEVQKMSGAYIPPTLGRITVAELAPAWLQLKETALKPSSYTPLESSWRNHVQPWWGATRLESLSLASAEEWISEMRGDGKGTTVILRAYGVLAGIVDLAVKQGRLVSNPVRGVENLPRKQRKEHVYLTHQQVQAFAAETRASEQALLVYTLAYTGLRWGELVALQAQYVEITAQRLHVRRNAVEVGSKVIPGTPKSHEARSVPMPRFLARLLAEHIADHSPTDLVFPGDDGDFLRRSKHARGWFARAAKRAGLPSVTPHDLRHTAASLAVSAGAHVKALQRMLGHASAAMTLDTYSGLFDSDLDGVAAALDKARTTAVVGKKWADATHLNLVRVKESPSPA